MQINLRGSQVRKNSYSGCAGPSGLAALTAHSDLKETKMRRLVAILMAVLFSAVTFSAHAIGPGTEGNPPAPQKHKQTKKKGQKKSQQKKSQTPAVEQGAPTK